MAEICKYCDRAAVNIGNDLCSFHIGVLKSSHRLDRIASMRDLRTKCRYYVKNTPSETTDSGGQWFFELSHCTTLKEAFTDGYFWISDKWGAEVRQCDFHNVPVEVQHHFIRCLWKFSRPLDDKWGWVDRAGKKMFIL
jgi:hypothetical protein